MRVEIAKKLNISFWMRRIRKVLHFNFKRTFEYINNRNHSKRKSMDSEKENKKRFRSATCGNLVSLHHFPFANEEKKPAKLLIMSRSDFCIYLHYANEFFRRSRHRHHCAFLYFFVILIQDKHKNTLILKAITNEAVVYEAFLSF